MSAEAEDIFYLRNGFCDTVVLFERASRQVSKKSRFNTVILFLIAYKKKELWLTRDKCLCLRFQIFCNSTVILILEKLIISTD